MIEAAALWLGEWATVKIAEVVLGSASSQLKAGDLDKALKISAEAANQQVRLFDSCYPRFVPALLDQIFNSLALEELQRPLRKEGTPRIAYLVEAFKVALQDHPKVKQDINRHLQNRYVLW